MFERRSVWTILIGLTVCISIWRISVQEPSMLAEYRYDSNTVGTIGNIPQPGAAASSALGATSFNAHQLNVSLDGGKHLLTRKMKDIDEEIRHHHNSNSITSRRRQTKTELFIQASSRNQETFYHVEGVDNSSRNNSTNIAQTTNDDINYDVSSHSNKVSGKRSIDTKFVQKVPNRKLTDFIKSTAFLSTTASQWFTLNRRTKTFPRSSPQSFDTKSPLSTNYQLTTRSTSRTTTSSYETLQSHLPADDFQKLIDLQDFDFIMSQPPCNARISALILIHSAPQNFKKRSILRETWAQRELLQGTPIRLIFLLGAVVNESLQYRLRQENDEFADMVQGNFMDDYRNLTYKHTMAFKWFIYKCAGAQILVKVDDDVFVNTLQLLQYLNNSSEALEMPQYQALFESNTRNLSLSRLLFNHPQNLLFCQRMVGSRVKRSYRSKWRVSVSEYSDRYYPPYCPGYSIIYSPDILLRLYKSLQTSKYFWIDDVHVTGTLAQLNNITITSSMPYVLSSDTCDELVVGKTDLKQRGDFLFAWPGITEQQIRFLWKLVESKQDNERTKSQKSMNTSYENTATTTETIMQYVQYRGFR